MQYWNLKIIGCSCLAVLGAFLLSSANAAPLNTTYTHEPAGRQTGVIYHDGTPNISIEYNFIDQPVNITDAAGNRVFTYNNKHLLAEETIPYLDGLSLRYQYDAVARLQAITLLRGDNTIYEVSCTYNPSGKISSISSGGSTLLYNYKSGLNLIANTSFLNDGNDVLSIVNTYNQQHFLTDTTGTANGSDDSYAYTMNAKNQRTAITLPNNQKWNYNYDNKGQVTSGVKQNHQHQPIPGHEFGYAYDDVGNRTSAELGSNAQAVNYSSNIVNQYTTINDELPTYDADGNMLTNGDWVCTYNSENRLIRAKKDSVKVEFKYDYKGRRFERKDYAKSGDDWILVATHKFVYNGYKLIAEFVDDELYQSFVWHIPALDSVAMVHKTDGDYYYMADGNKNIRNVFDVLGNEMANYDYDPFGKAITSNGVLAEANPFRFSSEYHNDLTGLVEYIYRDYDPTLGRWTTRDPIEEQGGVNLYVMVGNNAASWWDYLGWLTYEINKNGTDTVTIEKCEIVIFDGHGSETNPHIFVFPQDGFAAAGFTGCYSIVTNQKIQNTKEGGFRLIPGSPMANEEVETQSEEKKKQRKDLANGALSLLPNFCGIGKCCKVKISIHSNMGRGTKWFTEGNRNAAYSYDCKTKKLTKLSGSDIYKNLLNAERKGGK